MVHLFYTLVLALSVAPTPSILAGPTCANKSRRFKRSTVCTEPWGWPGFVKGTNPWGNVLSPSESQALSSALSSACASTSSSTASGVASSASHNVILSATSTTVRLSSSIVSSSSAVVPTTSKPSTTAISSTHTTSSQSVIVTPSATASTPSALTVVKGTLSLPPSSSLSSSISVSIPKTTSSTKSVSTSSPVSPVTTSSSSVVPLNSDISTYLSTHNTVRAAHGAAPLSWNNTLAAAAQTWANGCVFQHSGGKLGPFGENLAAGTGSAYDITSAVQSWTNEASQYDPSNPVASHFTQVVWKASTQLGCAEQSCSGIFSSSFGPAKYFVCEYFPQGNVIGAFAANVQV